MEDAYLEFLRCPITRQPLRREGEFLVTADNVKYPIKDNLPILIPDAAIVPPPYTSVEEFRKARGAGS